MIMTRVFLYISTLYGILCVSTEVILKVKFTDEKEANSFDFKAILSNYINKTDDSYKVHQFPHKDYYIFIISFNLKIHDLELTKIQNYFQGIKIDCIREIVLIKNNKIKGSDRLETHRELEANLRSNTTTKSPFVESDYFFRKNITGQNVKIAIFDSGINNQYVGCNLKEVINFTDEDDQDYNGHGTIISSNICRIAKNSSIYFFKVFNSQRKTTSSSLYKAILKAIEMDIKIFNFSFGGINFDDKLLTSIIKKAVINGVIIVCAAGNDGPAYGTINYPGNLPYILTIGALKLNELNELEISRISSRGPAIYRKAKTHIDKPDIWVIGENLVNFTIT